MQITFIHIVALVTGMALGAFMAIARKARNPLWEVAAAGLLIAYLFILLSWFYQFVLSQFPIGR